MENMGGLAIGWVKIADDFELRENNLAMTKSQKILQPPFIVGRSRAIMEMLDMVRRIAPSRVNVLIAGESGTGKELVARTLHHQSLRSKGPFIAVNCAALPENLIESELFGHEKGAFTGAVSQRIGKFERAHGGTILLDEIGEMPIPAQAKSLRVLEERELERLGGSRTIAVDVRVISATNRGLEKAIELGAFRVDLLYRLQGILITVPPLRERKDDLPLLVEHFISKHALENYRDVRGIAPKALDVLMSHSFPGNVRELENIIQTAVVLANGKEITMGELPHYLFEAQEEPRKSSDPGRIDRQKLVNAIEHAACDTRADRMKAWHKTLRANTLDTILQFLLYTDGKEFSRQEFANFLYERSQNARNKYGTVGRYLRVLKENHILAHNERKANGTRYRVSETFIAID
jgi:transcriptional regulator with GAF, ATPase, and Fis domain